MNYVGKAVSADEVRAVVDRVGDHADGTTWAEVDQNPVAGALGVEYPTLLATFGPHADEHLANVAQKVREQLGVAVDDGERARQHAEKGRAQRLSA